MLPLFSLLQTAQWVLTPKETQQGWPPDSNKPSRSFLFSARLGIALEGHQGFANEVRVCVCVRVGGAMEANVAPLHPTNSTLATPQFPTNSTLAETQILLCFFPSEWSSV